MQKMLKVFSVFGAATAAVLLPEIAHAVPTLQSQAASFSSGMGSFADLLTKGMFITGIGTGGMAALKFKEHNENPTQVKLSKPLTYLLASGMLIGLPQLLDITTNTVTGNSAVQHSFCTPPARVQSSGACG